MPGRKRPIANIDLSIEVLGRKSARTYICVLRNAASSIARYWRGITEDILSKATARDYTLWLLLADYPHYRRRGRSIDILGNSSSERRHWLASTHNQFEAEFRRVIARIFVLSLPPSTLSLSLCLFYPSPFSRNLAGLINSAKMLEPEVGATTVNLRRGTSLRIPSMSDPTEGKDQRFAEGTLIVCFRESRSEFLE